MSSIDLHIHSVVSADGEFSPEQILSMSEVRELRAISITDHNNINGARQALEAVSRYRIAVIPGIEIDCAFRGLNLHVLGYGIDIEDPAFYEIEKNAIEEERSVFPRFISRLHELGFIISVDDVLRNSPLAIPAPEYVGEVLLKSPENQHDERLKPYREGGSKSDMPYFNFYLDFCTKGKPAYLERHYPDLSSITHIIDQSGGISVLAHPGDSLSVPDEQLLPILEAGVSGIEVFSSYHTPDVTSYYWDKAREYEVKMTCGSDFHGKNKPTIALGSVECDGLDDKILNELM